MEGFPGQIVALGFLLRRWKAIRLSAISHSRMLDGSHQTLRRRTWSGNKFSPITANCSRLCVCNRHSRQRPAKMAAVRAPWEKTAASAGRSTPATPPAPFLPKPWGARIAGSHKAVGLPFTHQPQTYAHGGVALGANGLHRLILHCDHFAGVDDLEWQARRRRVTAEFRFDRLFGPTSSTRTP